MRVVSCWTILSGGAVSCPLRNGRKGNKLDISKSLNLSSGVLGGKMCHEECPLWRFSAACMRQFCTAP